MKRIIFLILIILNLFTVKAFSLEDNIIMVGSKESVYVGDGLTLSLKIGLTEDLYGFEIDLSYDDEYISIDSEALVGELLKDKNYFLAINEVEEGEIRLMGTLLGEEQSISEDGLLFKVNVKALKAGFVKVNVNTLKFVDVNGNEIEAKYKSNIINIKINNVKRKSYHEKPNVNESRFNIQGPEEVVDNLEVEEITIHSMEEEGLVALSNIFEITTKGKLTSPITITLPFIRKGNKDNIGIYYFHKERKKWLYLGGQVNLENSSITATVDHLTKFAVFEHNKKDFLDVNKHWSENYVSRLYLMGIIDGYEDGMFRPDKPITRGEIAVILTRILNISSNEEVFYKDDSSFPPWAKEAIHAVSEAGYFNGYDDGNFKHQINLTRAELMNVIGKILPNVEDKSTFRDSDKVPQWALDGVKTCISYGIVQGDDKGIRPKDNITRGEAATIIYRLLKILKI